MKKHDFWVSLLLLGVSSLAFGQWQWVDKNGRNVFSDRAPPPEVPDKSILKRPSPVPQTDSKAIGSASTGSTGSITTGASNASATASTPAPSPTPAPVSGLDKELEAKKKQAAEAEATKRKAIEDANARVRADNCQRAKQAKVSHESGLRMARTHANGEREFLDETSRKAELKRIQSAIQTECK